MNAFLDTPSVFSCAVDCFLEISFRLFVYHVIDISSNEGSNIFEIFTSVVPVYQTSLLNSDVSLMSQVFETIWNHIILNYSFFIPRKCDTEFSQIFTGNIFNMLSHEEKLLFETSFSAAGTRSQCNHYNQRNSAVIVSCISEVELANCNGLVDWAEVLSPNNDDTHIQCIECVTLINENF